MSRLQIQNIFMAFKQVPRCRHHWVHSKNRVWCRYSEGSLGLHVINNVKELKFTACQLMYTFMAISPIGGVFSYLPHHLDLASEDSVGRSTCMSVLARRRAIMGSIVQPKRSCLGAATGTAESPHRWGK